MRNLSNIIKKKLTAGVKILLVVGNMGESIVYPLPSNEVLVYSPPNILQLYIFTLLALGEEGKLYIYKLSGGRYTKKELSFYTM